ncbi:MAG: sensor domain-containing diguanylate cyclase [Clostridia bacterium]
MKKKRVPVSLTIALIISAGFVLTIVTSLFSFRSMFHKDVEIVSELTSENIYVNINNLMDRPINVSTSMAHDTFLRDFISEEIQGALPEGSTQTMTKYLASYQQKYQFDSVFFVSAKTGAYYHYRNGIDRTMTAGDPEDQWYYDFLASPNDCALNVDNDETTDDVITVFVNCKLYDERQNVLGVVGVGMETPYIQGFLRDNEEKYGFHAYLIDAAGNVQLSSSLTEFGNVNLFENPIFYAMADAIRVKPTQSDQRWYHSRETDGYIITKYVPNLNWYLVVENNVKSFQNKLFLQLGIDFIFLLLVVSVVIVITMGVIRKYDHKLVSLAETDQLTGIRNRTSYEREIAGDARHSERYQTFGIGICDLNGLKEINDLYGHQAGDTYLQTIAAMLIHAFPTCPVFRIGGDEFALIFENLTEEIVANCWKTFLKNLCDRQKSAGFAMSVAFGYAFSDAEQAITMDQLFKMADDKMYRNKKQMKQSG